MTVKTPEKLKDSGVEWLGKIPTNWKTERAKHLFYQKQRPPKESDDIVTAFRDGEVTLRSLRRTEGYTFADKEIGYQHVDIGDLVIHAMDAFAGAIGVSDSAGKMSPVCSVCAPVNHREVNVEFYAHLLRTMTKSGYLRAISKGIRQRSTDFRYKDFANLHLPVPDKETQNKIVKFINDETAKIDNLIAKQERLLELLEEKRRTTITHAVTRGLDPNVELKETNIPWLSKIPAHWKLARASMLFNENRRSNNALESLQPKKFMFGEIVDKDIKIDEITQEEIRRYTVVEENDIIINGLNLNYDFVTQRVAITKSKGCITPAYISLRARTDILPKYASYLLKGFDGQKILNGWGTGIRLTLNYAEFKKKYLPQPSIEEQQQFISFLDNYIIRSDNLEQRIQVQITLLRERRTSLISHAVTGRIEI